METHIDEIGAGIYRLSTYVPQVAPPHGMTFNQFLICGEEPLLFHTGRRHMFAGVRDAVARVLPPERLRWITFGHYESDECGSMNDWLAVAPNAEVAHGQTACRVSLDDMADRPPLGLADGAVIDLGRGMRVRYFDTPHVPHGWEAGVLYEESTGTLLCGDLFTQLGNAPPTTSDDIVAAAIEAEDLFHFSTMHPATGQIIRRLAETEPRVLALMHGPSFRGDGGATLRALAEAYDRRIRASLPAD